MAAWQTGRDGQQPQRQRLAPQGKRSQHQDGADTAADRRNFGAGQQGIADADKICIVGAGYGGYAAMMDAIHAPDLYQCAVSYAGVSDLEYLVKMARNYTNYESVKQQIGDDFSLLEQNSPLTHVDKINVPVLLLHGTDDRSVPYQQSDMMYKALLRQNKPVEYIEFDKGDHYLSNNSHRLETFKAMDRFLKQHLKAN